MAGLENLNQIRAVCFGTQLAVDFVDLASFIDADNRSSTFLDYRGQQRRQGVSMYVRIGLISLEPNEWGSLTKSAQPKYKE